VLVILARIFNILWASDFCQQETQNQLPVPGNWQAAVSGGGGEPIQDAFPISVYVSSHIICGHTTWGKNKIKTLTLNSLMLTRPRTCRIAEPVCKYCVHTRKLKMKIVNVPLYPVVGVPVYYTGYPGTASI
jgi:hypothetical protein